MVRNKICETCKQTFTTTKWWCARFCPTCRIVNTKNYQHQYKASYIKSGDNAYIQLKQRCENPNNQDYRFYGAKGIRVTISQEDFCVFYNSESKCEICGILFDQNKRSRSGKCVDRIDSKKDYEGENMRLLCRGCNTQQSCKSQTRGYHGRYK